MCYFLSRGSLDWRGGGGAAGATGNTPGPLSNAALLAREFDGVISLVFLAEKVESAGPDVLPVGAGL